MAKMKKSPSTSAQRVTPKSVPNLSTGATLNAPGATKMAKRFRGVKPIQRSSSK